MVERGGTRFWYYMGVLDEKKVKIVTLKPKGNASVW